MFYYVENISDRCYVLLIEYALNNKPAQFIDDSEAPTQLLNGFRIRNYENEGGGREGKRDPRGSWAKTINLLGESM